LPVPGAVADGVDVRNCRAPVLVGGDSGPLVELDADSLQTEPFDHRAAPHRDEHQIRLNHLPVSEMDGQLGAALLDPRALLLEVERDAALAELLGELLR